MQRSRQFSPGDQHHDAGGADAEHAACDHRVVGVDVDDLGHQLAHQRQLGGALGPEQHLQVRGRGHHFGGQQAQVPVGLCAGGLADQLGHQDAKPFGRRQRCMHELAECVDGEEPPVGFDQRGLVEAAAAAKVIVDGGQVHTGVGRHRLAGGLGKALAAEQLARGLQDAGAGGFAVGTGGAGTGGVGDHGRIVPDLRRSDHPVPSRGCQPVLCACHEFSGSGGSRIIRSLRCALRRPA